MARTIDSFESVTGGPWDSAIIAFKRGGRVTKKELVQLLELDVPIPDEAKPLLAGVISGEIVLKQGNVSEYPDWYWEMLADFAAEIAKVGGEWRKLRKKGHPLPSRAEGYAEGMTDAAMRVAMSDKKPSVEAREIVAEQAGVNPSTLRAQMERLRNEASR
ncbi:MAG: hypothetical protein FKY71_15275 [Spiribacter salinus]|uniref:Uncharacterized protein n=1 Tax=Spiribacter salinus TaxID=1335746 RepID=A0A540VN79_9GAMM|nr:MAG: hypothetical protein FKY71_15275 [Spiribacter salinus]